MLNFSKNFVTYLDNYDKTKQTKYKNRNLFLNIEKEFINNFIFNFEDTHKEPILSSPKEVQDDNSFNYLASTNVGESTFKNEFFFEPLKNSVDINTADKEVKEKEKIEIDERIETLEDVLKIIEKYELSEECEYNIDLKVLKKIKPELESLDKMIGIQKLKQNVLDQLLYFIQNLHISQDGGDYKHTVIYGPPGTGKTEIAKIIGTMYSKIGVLDENKFVKVSRQDLIAGYLGQTAIKTGKVIQKAIGGVLFIDEAYSLASTDKEDSFSKECLDTLCESLSNYKNELMVIIAGYEDELESTFFRSNRGLNSRFIWRFTMEPYDSDELVNIFLKIVKNNQWDITENENLDKKWFKTKYEEFPSYGRDMEQLFTCTKICHSRRIYGKDKDLRKKINMEDVKAGFKMFMENKKKKVENKHLYSMYL
tara:strand:- start:12320 stop:13588 length:1269 start_codon:yes stop_codon:yes gene_type:complete